MIIDLCCGIGRFEGDEVVSIDFDPKTKPDIVADIRHLPLRPSIKPEHLHMSPPCRYMAWVGIRQFGMNFKGIAESLELVAACFEAIDYLEPKHWTLENPMGLLNKLFYETKISYKVYDLNKKKTLFFHNKKALKRSVIPKDVRQHLLTVEGQNKSNTN